MWLLIPVLITFHVLVCLLLVLAVLMQLPRSEGLGAAFGGSVTENIFGAQTTHVLAKFTVWLGIAFFAITLALAMAFSHQQSSKSKIGRELMSEAAPAAVTAPAAAAVAEPTPATAATPASTTAVTTPSSTPEATASTPAEATPVAPSEPVAPVAPAATPTPAAP